MNTKTICKNFRLIGNRAALLIMALVFTQGCSSDTNPLEPSDKIAAVSAWPEGDRLFHSNPKWLGSDAAYSIDLGSGRALWLFGDSFIDTTGDGLRATTKFIRNSAAIQHGYDPLTARMEFAWRGTEKAPEPFFANSPTEWLWPGGGVRLDNQLILFLMRVRLSSADLGFEIFGVRIVAVTNPDDEPLSWQIRTLREETSDIRLITGSSTVLREGDFVYAFSTRESGEGHPVFLARWPVEAFNESTLPAAEWWGNGGQWVASSSNGAGYVPVFNDGQTEVTVHYDEKLKRYVEIQTWGFGDSPIVMRTASALTGPWSEAELIYTPPENQIDNTYTYAGKAHPQLIGSDLVLTYASNSFSFDQLVADTRLYYPRFVRVQYR